MNKYVLIAIIPFIISCGSNNKAEKEHKETYDSKSNNVLIDSNSINLKVNEEKMFIDESIREKSCFRYKYKFNNSNLSKFGFYPTIDFPEEGDGIKAISSDSKFVYLLDGYHKNIKKVNIETGEYITSFTFENDNLIDLIIYDEKIYVTSRFKGLYILNKELKLTSTLDMSDYSNHEKYLYSDDDTVFVYVPFKSINIPIINEKLDLRKITKKYMTFFGEGIIRNEKFLYQETDSILLTKYGDTKLYYPYRNTFKYYNSLNISYSRKYLTFFTIDSAEYLLELNFYEK